MKAQGMSDYSYKFHSKVVGSIIKVRASCEKTDCRHRTPWTTNRELASEAIKGHIDVTHRPAGDSLPSGDNAVSAGIPKDASSGK